MSKVRNTAGMFLVLAPLAGGGCLGDQEPATSAVRAAATAAAPAKLDLLFMVDNSSSMTSAQQKLVQEMQSFAATLESLPGGLPDLHVAVVSSDMGAPGDQINSLGCTLTGDQGAFQLAPRGDCATAWLAPDATYISNSGGVPNYTGTLSDVLSCIAPLGSSGCGFEHQLASVARALGADGKGPPPQVNDGFLRPDAELAIILLSNEDDCSAPSDTQLFSLGGRVQGIENPLGPLANYRCNRFGHLCRNPSSAEPQTLVSPPLQPPVEATGDPPVLTMTACASDDRCDAMLTPVQTFVSEIKALKGDPSQIVVGAIVAPPEPYAVTWVAPLSQPPGTAPEIWPQIMHSCGPSGMDDLNPAGQISSDGTFGDPAVRITQWVRGFGRNGFVSSICDPTYAGPMQQFAALISAHLQPAGAVVADGATVTPPSPTCAARPAPQPGLVAKGCSTSGGRPGPTGLLFVAAGLAVLCRRRRRR